MLGCGAMVKRYAKVRHDLVFVQMENGGAVYYKSAMARSGAPSCENHSSNLNWVTRSRHYEILNITIITQTDVDGVGSFLSLFDARE